MHAVDLSLHVSLCISSSVNSCGDTVTITEEMEKRVRDIWRKSTRRKPTGEDLAASKVAQCLTTTDLISLGLVHVLGSGVYLWTGAIMVYKAGAATVLSFLAGGVLALLASLCYAQFSVNVPHEGKAYTYMCTVSGELGAFLVGWTLLLEYSLGTAFIGRRLSASIWFLISGDNATSTWAPSDAHYFPIHLDFLAGGIVIVAFVITAIGLKRTTAINITLTVINLITIAIIIVGGFYLGSTKNFDGGHGGFLPFGWSGMVNGGALAFCSYIGFDAVSSASNEVPNSSRTIPLVMVVSVGVAMVLFCLTSMALSFLEPFYDVNSLLPFQSAFGKYNLTSIMYIIWSGSFLGNMASLIHQSGRICKEIHTLASDGLLPMIITYICPSTQTPMLCIILAAVVTTTLTTLLDAYVFIDLAATGSLFTVVLLTFSLLRLHYLPPEQCPFELDQDGLIKEVMIRTGCPEDRIHLLENHSTGQNTEDIGRLKVAVPILRRCRPKRVIDVTMGILVISATGLALVLIRGWPFLLQAQLWIIVSLGVSLTTFLLCAMVLLLYEHNRSFAYFQVGVLLYISE